MLKQKTKYNTLTPAEAKKLTRFLNGRPPIRTASVLHKPRAPPMIVTSLDDYEPRTTATVPPSSRNYANTNGLPIDTFRGSNRGARSASSCSNFSYRDQRHSMNYGRSHTINNGNRYSTLNSNVKCITLNSGPSDDTESNLSFRSSLDIVDSAYGSGRLQTMSVDLGNPSQHHNGYNYAQCPTTDNRLSDDSFSSAKSHQSDSSKLKTSNSKNSLSSSTSRIFQNQLVTLKKFFSHMPIKRGFLSTNQPDRKVYDIKDTEISESEKESLNESMSQLYLTGSQSPPVCPPPPKELKSMSYMESSINYSNYDDFTRVRNMQTSTLLGGQIRAHQQLKPTGRVEHYGSPQGDSEDSIPWQLTSLPVSYERNLTTVFEEKQNSTDLARNFDKKLTFCGFNNVSNTNNNETGKQMIKPPLNFQDERSQIYDQDKDRASSTNSSQSLTSTTTADSVLDYHRQTGTSFRFSYAQPNAIEHNNGLPPKMPASDTKQGISIVASSDSPPSAKTIDNDSDQVAPEKVSLYDEISDYGAVIGQDDTNTTITSDTSTLHGDSSNVAYISKCAELERTVDSLKNKLVSKEKELTDLQLKQWSSDYLIDQLRSTISKLEKENGQLKAMVVKVNRVNL